MNSQNTRLYYIDWLRLLALGLLFIFHAWRPFDHYDWSIKNAEQSSIFDFLTMFFHGWRMDLIFLVSGVGTWYALASPRSNFLKDRIFRLIVPYIMGVVLIIPPQKFIEAITLHGFEGNYFDFMTAWPGWALSSNFGASVLIWFAHLGAHIYYLPFLFTMTLLFLGAYKVARRVPNIQRMFTKLSATSGGAFLLVIPLITVRYGLKPLFPGYTDWADFFYYMCMFGYGFIFIKNPQFMNNIKTNIWTYFCTGLLSFALLTFFFKQSADNIQMFFSPKYGLTHLYLSTLSAFISFGWVMFFLALAARKLNFNHKILKTANEAILPVYLLHQTVIIVFGFYILQMNINILTKFAIILFTAIPFSLIMYIGIRRINILRLIFGMKTDTVHLK